MQEQVASFLSFQIRRSTESGDAELAMAQMRQYLELERAAKVASTELGASTNVRRLPARLRSVN
jgi:hypothetical protein